MRSGGELAKVEVLKGALLWCDLSLTNEETGRERCRFTRRALSAGRPRVICDVRALSAADAPRARIATAHAYVVAVDRNIIISRLFALPSFRFERTVEHAVERIVIRGQCSATVA